MKKVLYLRLLFALNLKAGGSVGHTAGVIHGLANHLNVDVVSNDELTDVKEPIRIIHPIFTRFFPGLFLELFNNLQFLYYLWSDKQDVEAIYQRHTAFSFAGAVLARHYNVPFILEFNSSEVWKLKNWKEEKKKTFKQILKSIYSKLFMMPYMKWIESFNLRNADEIVVVSQVTKENLVSAGVPERKILVNPNGVMLEKFSPGCGGDKIRERYQLQEKKVIGFIGTFGQWHGVCELAQAIVKLFTENPQYKENVRFLLVGDGILASQVKAILQDGRVDEFVVMPGLVPQHEAPAYLDACDIFVSPHIPNPDGSKFFGSPTKLFEYMAMERGIVASDLDQIGDILDDGVTARMVTPGDVAELTAGIIELIEKPDLTNRLGINAREEVIRKYTWDKHVERILEKLEELKV